MYRYLIKQRFCPTPIRAYSICAKTFHTVTYGAKSILVLNPLNVDHQSIRTSGLTRACCGAAESVKFTSLCQLWCEMGTFENVKQVSEQQSWFSAVKRQGKTSTNGAQNRLLVYAMERMVYRVSCSAVLSNSEKTVALLFVRMIVGVRIITENKTGVQMSLSFQITLLTES